MGSKHRNAQQMELFDGQAVEKYQLAFKGSAFHTDEVDIEKLVMDDHICLLVVAEVAESGFKKNTEGDVIRVNKLQQLRVVELDASIGDYALAKQKAAAGTPMLPNFSDPDEDDDELDDDDLDTDDSVAVSGNEPIEPYDANPTDGPAEDTDDDAPSIDPDGLDKPEGVVLSGR